MTEEQSRRYRALCQRCGYTPLPLQVNGCVFMPRDDLLRVLEGHRRTGYDAYMMTIAGLPKTHDAWAGRRGEFAYLRNIAAAAALLGYQRIEKVLLTRTSLPQLEELFPVLDGLGGPSRRVTIPVDNAGRGRYLERERLDRRMLGGIPNPAGHQTEGEWIAWLERNDGEAKVKHTHQYLTVDGENVDRWEREDCGRIYDEYYRGFMETYRLLPEIVELAHLYGDKTNDKLYALHELERKWVMRYLQEHSTRFTRPYQDCILRRE
jgi:hypothetical protein